MDQGRVAPGCRHVTIAGAEIEYLDTATGPPLVFLHEQQGLDPQASYLSRLAERFRVIAPSHPGFGRSSRPAWLDSVDDIAHVYLELLDRLALDDVVLVGASLGAWIAAEMATKSVERISRVVLIGPIGLKLGSRDRLDIPDVFAMSDAALARATYHDLRHAAFEPASRSDDELAAIARNRESFALIAWEPYLHNPKLRHRLQRVARPTLILRGENDGLVQDWYAEAYAGLIPGAVLHTVPAAGHLPHLEQPDRFFASVLAFLN